jgi:hypothetical protein
MGDTRQNQGDRISLGAPDASATARVRGPRPQVRVVVAVLGLTIASPASADPGGDASPPVAMLQADLDGWYLHLGPAVAAVRREGAWDSAIGGTLSVTRVREHDLVSIVGGRAYAARWSLGGGRVAAEALAAFGSWKIGVTGGPLIDLADLHHPRIGASAAIWCFAGVVPYLRVGVIEASGGFVEAGLEIPLPVWRHR